MTAVNKHKTVIGENAFIGSDTMLVAPVTIGEGAKTGAGSVVTHDVPDHTVGGGSAGAAFSKNEMLVSDILILFLIIPGTGSAVYRRSGPPWCMPACHT